MAAPTPLVGSSWSTAALATGGKQLALYIFRPLGGSTYQTVTHDGPHSLASSAVNLFQVNLAVKAGDVLGLDSSGTSFPTACGFAVPGETGELTSFPNPAPPDGQSGPFSPSPGNRVNVAAQFDPSNDFGVAGQRKNKKKGQVTITLNLPGPGTVALAGKGLKSQSASFAIAAGGPLAVKVIPKGKVAKRLRAHHRLGVTPTITFTPSGGTATTKSVNVKLVSASRRLASAVEHGLSGRSLSAVRVGIVASDA